MNVRLLTIFCAVLMTASNFGHWLTQTNVLKPGWNAVFLHVDASHATLQELVDADNSNPITEIWMWKLPVSEAQFVHSPQMPVESGSQWLSWVRTLGPSSDLQRLIGNTAYLVHIPEAGGEYAWKVKGKAVPPSYNWTTTGLNLVGFPTVPSNPPFYDAFLAKEPELQNAEIFHYPGGPLGAGNPAKLFALRTKRVARGESVWIRSGTHFNKYFAPFEVTLQNRNGVLFGQKAGQNKLRIKNLTAASLVVRLSLIPSEEAPASQPVVAGTPEILVRGALNPTNITYAFARLGEGIQEWTLAPEGQPGSDREIVVGVNRFAMPGNAGDLYAAVLRFTDGLGFSQIDLPVSATVPGKAGLWVGNAAVKDVRHFLRNYERLADGSLALDENGKYVVQSVNTNLGKVAKPYNLRLIVHQDNNGNAVLMQRVFHGLDAGTNVVVATKEDLLHPKFLTSARRISAVHLPFSPNNNTWSFTGEFAPGTNATATVVVGEDDHASNPFLHTYHPDHDNLDPLFETTQPKGAESFLISRKLSLFVTAPNEDFDALTAGSDTMVGLFQELVSVEGTEIPNVGPETRDFDVSGVFMLKQLSDVPTLTTN